MQMQETLVDKIPLHRIYTYTCTYMHVILIAVDMLLCSYLITLQDIASVITFLLQCAIIFSNSPLSTLDLYLTFCM